MNKAMLCTQTEELLVEKKDAKKEISRLLKTSPTGVILGVRDAENNPVFIKSYVGRGKVRRTIDVYRPEIHPWIRRAIKALA